MSICTKEVVYMGFLNKKSTTVESTETQELKRLLEEARELMASGYSATAAQAIGYKELIPWLDGEAPLEDCLERIRMQSRRYAKRQLTWFRRDERIHWFFPDDYSDYDNLYKNVVDYIEKTALLCYTKS